MKKIILIIIAVSLLSGVLGYVLKPQKIIKEEVVETIVKEKIVEVHKCSVIDSYSNEFVKR